MVSKHPRFRRQGGERTACTHEYEYRQLIVSWVMVLLQAMVPRTSSTPPIKKKKGSRRQLIPVGVHGTLQLNGSHQTSHRATRRHRNGGGYVSNKADYFVNVLYFMKYFCNHCSSSPPASIRCTRTGGGCGRKPRQRCIAAAWYV